MNLLGLEGIANLLGFVLQTTAIGAAVWLGATCLRSARHTPSAGFSPERDRTVTEQ